MKIMRLGSTPMLLACTGVVVACGGQAAGEGASRTRGGSFGTQSASSDPFGGGAANASARGGNSNGATTARSSSAGGAPSSGEPLNGSAGGSTPGATAVGGRSALSATGGSTTSGTIPGGAGSSAGGTSSGAAGTFQSGVAGSGSPPQDCINACELYGAPCCFEGANCLRGEHHCAFEFLSSPSSSSPPYEYADFERELNEAPRDVRATISDAQIAWVAADPYPAARMAFHLTEAASSSFPDEGSQGIPFRVTCDGEVLFLGVTYLYYGAAAFKVPALHVLGGSGESKVLYLGAWQGSWQNWAQDPEEAKERIDRPELRAAFCQLGSLRELEADARIEDP